MPATQVKEDREASHHRTTHDRETAGERDAGRHTPHTAELKENISEAGSSLREAASNAVPAAREQIDRAGERLAMETRSFEESLFNSIREKPLTSVLIAAGIGMFTGLFLRRR